jgi:hypothetical protein
MTPKKTLLGALLAIFATAALAFAVSAAADRGHRDKGEHRGHTVFSSRLVGSKPAPTDPPIHAVAPGGVPWDGGGSVRLRSDGRIDVRTRGLIITGTDNAGPVKTVSASLFCEGSDTPAATTGQVPLSPAGDARIEQRLTLPATCLGPIVLVHPNGNVHAYIAATGWRG